MMNNSQGASSFFSGLSTLLGRPHPLLHNLSDTTPPTPRQVTSDDPTDTVLYLLSLDQLREEAFYPRGEYPGSTGREALSRYQGGGELSTTDREIFVSVEVPDALNPPGVSWWRMPIMQYASLRAFMKIENTAEFRHIWRHKDAAFSPFCSPATVPTLP